MRNAFLTAGALACLALPLQGQSAPGQTSQQYSFRAAGDGLVRYESTRDLFAPAGSEPPADQNRWRLQARPRIEMGVSWLLLGVGGEFNYSDDENTTPPPLLLRDNYESRDARVDLAFLSLKPADWLQLQGGRFEMPSGLTEMIWDKDLRPQGGAITFEKKDKAGVRRFALTGLYGQGSHVFEDADTKMFLGQLEVASASASLTASYIEWRDTFAIEPMIRRQNTRVAGAFTRDYRVVDGVLRLRGGEKLNSQLIVDYCWNTAADEDNRGLWIAAVLGSTESARSRFEYTFADVDKDATLAAYASDDFFWSTGWTGHRGDLGFKAGKGMSLHLVAQWQRFKDSPRVEEQDHWVKRWRAELRFRH